MGSGALRSLVLHCACGPHPALADLRHASVLKPFLKTEAGHFLKALDAFFARGFASASCVSSMAPGAGTLSIWLGADLPRPFGKG